MNEILMYGEIGFDITDSQFIEQLSALNGQDVKIRANSPGGAVFQGWAMYNAIIEHGQCDIQIDGLAASMMTVIMLAGRKITASKNAMIMIHNPSFLNGEDREKSPSEIQLLDKVKKLITDSYSERTGLSIDEITLMLDAETWLTAQEAFEQGFIDEVTEEVLQKTAPNTKVKNLKAVYMSYKKEINKSQSLTALLGLKHNSDSGTIIQSVKSLKNKNISLEAENRRIKTEILNNQKIEAKELITIGIKYGVINKHLEAVQLLAFERNFKKTKTDLQLAISEVQNSQALNHNHKLIREVVLGRKKQVEEVKITDKPKSEWTLQDYRKHAPKELENDKDLYTKLIKEEYNH
ncbi:Clp protease ClpP [Flavobacterium branchiarum]|uniref:ATP-dependent Clp protease proteolytic subunit n=1 Tax=Flavobacterium branchiarum TaxID=1114870 RepID=A0ABV5FHF5_9FLAO|nr:head maturation protease, ClpP-related [Flavobacterium branchiarum]MDN3673878.1 Clp protease ClpP [Flavobacterium branchiarum]